jgi:RNA polymerase sigma-70 factor (ECF subfamily)
VASDPRNSHGVPDAALVERLTAGERDAFAELFRRYQGLVHRFVKQMTGSADVADDTTQEVFLALARGGARYEPALGSLSTYLYGIARHLVFRRHRRDALRQAVDVHAIDGDESARLATMPDPLGDLSRAERVRTLRRAILHLPLHYREAIVLCELHGLSYEAAARVMGCPVGTVRSRLHRGRKLLLERCRTTLAAEAGDAPAAWKPEVVASWSQAMRPKSEV